MKRGRSVSTNLRRGAALAALGVLAGCDVSSKPLVAMFAVRTPTGVGYGIVNSGGVIYGVNGVPSDHTLEHTRLNGPIIDATPRPKGGVWLVATDGGVFSLGGAPYYGNVLGQVAPGTTRGIAATPTGRGYWIVSSDGHVFARGDAVHYHDLITDHVVPSQPVVGIAATPSGHGYWLVARDGGIFSFGDASYHGNARQSAHPVVGMAAAGGGYWITATDGGVFTSDNQQFHGSHGNDPPAKPIVDIVATPDGEGYWLLDKDGAVFPYGSAPDFPRAVVWSPPTTFCEHSCTQQENAATIVALAHQHGVTDQGLVNTLLGVAACESGILDWKTNNNSDGTVDKGLFQFNTGGPHDTWRGQRDAYFGGDQGDPLNAVDNAATAAEVVSHSGFPSVWHDAAGHLDPYLDHIMHGAALPDYCRQALINAGYPGLAN